MTTIVIGSSLPLTGEFSQPGQAAEQGYKVWQEMVNADGGLLGRQVELVIKDDASNQNTIVTDYNALISQDKVDLLLGTFSSLLNLPASAVAERSQMVYVEPAGGSPDMFNRGFEYLFFAQQSTADKQGKVCAEWVAQLPDGEKPETAAYPTLDDPFAAPNVAGIQAILEEAGIETVYEETYAIDTKNFDTIVSAMKNADPDLVVHGAQFEDGIGMTRAMLKADFTPGMFFQTNAPSFGSQFTDGIGEDEHRGHLLRGQPLGRRGHPRQRRVRGQVRGDVRRRRGPRGRGRRLRRRRGAPGGRRGRRQHRRPGGARRLAARERGRDHPRPAVVGRDRSPQGDFLIGQWQDGAPQIVLPEDAATAEIERDWMPGGAG